MAERRFFLQPVEQVVRTYADANPQKLRQIGLQYDLAHTKGGVVDEDEALQSRREGEKKKKKQKKKKDEKRERQMDDAMKRMEEAMLQMRLELARQREQEKEREEKQGEEEVEDVSRPKKPEGKPEEVVEQKGSLGDSKSFLPGYWPEESSKATPESQSSSERPKASSSPDKPENVREKNQDRSPPVTNTHSGPAPSEDQPQIESPVQSSSVFTPPTDPDDISAAENSDTNSDSDSDSDSDSEPSSDSDNDSDDDSHKRRRRDKRKPWNAVCVMGLRVYAQHAGVKVRLADQQGDEALALVTTDGKPAVGPTL